MSEIIKITLKGIFRDRVFHGIMVLSILFLFVPSVASLSMRQVTELSITLTLSLISFILLLLAIFLGGTTLWKDIERRYTFSVLSLPISRGSYLLGRFLGVALFLLLTALFLGSVSAIVVKVASGIYPSERPLVWSTLFLAVLFDAGKYILLVALAMLFSTFSTSFFLPVFGSISIYLAGNVTQQVYDYLHSAAAKNTGALLRWSGNAIYYLLPNLSAFDLKVNAIYALPLNTGGLLLTVGYWIIYLTVILSGAVLVLGQREMK